MDPVIAKGVWLLRGNQIEIFRIELSDHLDLATQEATHFDFAIGLDVETDRIQIRKPSVSVAVFQEARIFVSAVSSRRVGNRKCGARQSRYRPHPEEQLARCDVQLVEEPFQTGFRR